MRLRAALWNVILLGCGLVLAGLLAISRGADASTFVLTPNGSGSVATFQAGVDSLTSRWEDSTGGHDTLFVMPGNYDESVRWNNYGQPSDVVICPGGKDLTRVRSLRIEPSFTRTTSLEDFGDPGGPYYGFVTRVRGLTVSESLGVESGNFRTALIDCRFLGPFYFRYQGTAYGGLFKHCDFFSSVNIRTAGAIDSCSFTNGQAHIDGFDEDNLAIRWCTFTGQDTALFIGLNCRTVISNCSFSHVGRAVFVPSWHGLYYYDWYKPLTVERCLFVDVGRPVEAYITSVVSPAVTVRYSNTWTGAGGDPYVGNVGDYDNLTLDPQCCDLAAGDFHLAAGSPCAPSGPYGQIGALGVGCDVMTVPVDVQPLSRNPINLGSNAPVEAAILGHRLFDPRRVDPATVRLAGAMPSPRGRTSPQLKDVNQDGIADLLLSFNAQDLHLESGEVTLEGGTFDGVPFRGADVVEVRSASLATIDEVYVPNRLALSVTRAQGGSGLDLLFDLPSEKPVTVEVFDVAGRRVQSRDLLALGPGQHRVQLQDRLASGLYLLRLKQGTAAVVARALVMR